MQAKAQRIRRFDKRCKFQRQNKSFKEHTKRFYRELGKKINRGQRNTRNEDFWSKIWEDIKTYKSDSPWIKDQENTKAYQEQQKWIDDELTTAHNDIF